VGKRLDGGAKVLLFPGGFHGVLPDVRRGKMADSRMF